MCSCVLIGKGYPVHSTVVPMPVPPPFPPLSLLLPDVDQELVLVS